MKNCPSGETLSRYLDGELDGDGSLRVEEHLESCPRCRQRAEELDRTGEFLLRAAAASSAVPDYLERKMAEKLFPRGEVFLGVIGFCLSRLKGCPVSSGKSDFSPAELVMAAERPLAYGAGRGLENNRGHRQSLTGEGIEAAIEFFRGEKGSAACRLAVRDREGRPLNGVRLQLEKEGKMVWSFLARGEKEPIIPRLLPGRYRLRIEHGPTYGLILDLR